MSQNIFLKWKEGKSDQTKAWNVSLLMRPSLKNEKPKDKTDQRLQ